MALPKLSGCTIKGLKICYTELLKKNQNKIFLDNWTIRIRIFWRFRCREQVNRKMTLKTQICNFRAYYIILVRDMNTTLELFLIRGQSCTKV